MLCRLKNESEHSSESIRNVKVKWIKFFLVRHSVFYTLCSSNTTLFEFLLDSDDCGILMEQLSQSLQRTCENKLCAQNTIMSYCNNLR